ncbi:cofilin/tropomyosin-type actin-binding protein [Sarocladium implicatum]|nr:cofilin/tropomyosin-type actin-binding protein [Sarocladium implicatum]
MSGLDSTDIVNAYEAIRSDQDQTNWLLLSHDDRNSPKLTLKGSGSGGMEELQACLRDEDVQYGLVQVPCANEDEGGFKLENVFVYWMPEGANVKRRMRAASESEEVKKFLSDYTLAVKFERMDDFNIDTIVSRLE